MAASVNWSPNCLKEIRSVTISAGHISSLEGESRMNTLLLKQYVRLQTLLGDESGQDLIEYALVVALIAFAATAGMGSVANKINVAFTNIGNKLTTYITT
jgi:pilus assembly protein Flp/PilA